MGMSNMKRALAVALTGASAVLVMAAPGLAAGTGNTTNNCYGVYFSTDWDQNCAAGGASATGYYQSTADCTNSGDSTLTVYRTKGSTASKDGSDCRWQVVNVRTVFFT